MPTQLLAHGGITDYMATIPLSSFNGDPCFPPYYDQPFWKVVSLYDPIGRFFAVDEGILELGVRSLPWPPSPSGGDFKVIDFHPVKAWPHDRAEDDKLNGSTLSSLGHVIFGDTLSYQGEVSLNGEHNCTHPGSRGRLTSGSIPSLSYLHDTELMLYRAGNGPYGYSDYVQNDWTSIAKQADGTWYRVWLPTSHHFTLSSFLENYPKDYTFGHAFSFDGECQWSWSRLSSGDIIATTHVKVHIGGAWHPPDVDYTYEWNIGWQFCLSAIPWWWYYPDQSVWAWILVPRNDLFKVTSCVASCSRAYDLTTPNFATDFISGYYIGYQSYEPHSSASLTPDGINVLSSRISASDLGFRDFCESQYIDLRPATYLSTVDAVSKMGVGTTTDVLQTLAKLPEYRSLIPKIEELVAVCGAIRKKQFNPSTVKDLVDIVAQTDLQASFQWRPLAELITIELPKILRGIARNWDSQKLLIGRGSYHYDFSFLEFQPYLNAKLTTRTKVVCDTSFSDVFRRLIAADRLGVLPKPSNLWDLIPYSFVVNWITGIGKLMRQAEYGLITMTVPTYFVHSITLEAEPTTQTLDTWQVSSDQTSPFRFRWYRRIVSRHFPFPSSTKYGFGSNVGNPPFHVVGSLLYQIIF